MRIIPLMATCPFTIRDKGKVTNLRRLQGIASVWWKKWREAVWLVVEGVEAEGEGFGAGLAAYLCRNKGQTSISVFQKHPQY
jgi:hypothetical protein